MPYSPTDNYSINVILSNDLSGTLDNPYVVSVNNIASGVLSVENGGLETSSIPYGSIIIGRDELTPYFLTGSSNSILYWSDISSSWEAKSINFIEDVQLSSSENDIFEIEDLSVGKDKKYSITFKNSGNGFFLATPTASNGKLGLRRIEPSDLPSEFTDIVLLNSTLTGSFSGSIITNYISGDGSALYNLSSSQIDNFSEDVETIVKNTEFTFNNVSVVNLIASSSFIEQLVVETGSISGTFSGDGSELTNINVYNIDNFSETVWSLFTGSNGILINSGNISLTKPEKDIFSLSDNIIINSGSTSIIFDLSDNLSLNSLTASSLKTDNLSINNLNSDNISATLISSSTFLGNFSGVLSGTYSGSGQYINSIPNSSLQFPFININNNEVSLGQSIQVSGLSSITSSNNNISIVTSGSNVGVSLSEILTVDTVLASVISGATLYGDGRNITNISLDSVEQEIMQIARDGIYLDNITLITGSGNEIKVNTDNISLGDITANEISSQNIIVGSILASAITASYFVGDGSKLNNISATVGVSCALSSSSIQVGDVVYLTSYGADLCDNRYKQKNNPTGILITKNGNNSYLLTNGVFEKDIAYLSCSVGDIIYLGQTGSCIKYENIPTGSYATQIGTVVETNKVSINFKKLWKVM